MLLNQLPIQHALLDHKLTLQLKRLGLNTLGQAQALPKSALGQRLGKNLVNYLHQLEDTSAPPQT